MVIQKYLEIIAGLVDSVIVIHVEAIAVSVMLMETVGVRLVKWTQHGSLGNTLFW